MDRLHIFLKSSQNIRGPIITNVQIWAEWAYAYSLHMGTQFTWVHFSFYLHTPTLEQISYRLRCAALQETHVVYMLSGALRCMAVQGLYICSYYMI